jgi:hypothetical protein
MLTKLVCGAGNIPSAQCSAILTLYLQGNGVLFVTLKCVSCSQYHLNQDKMYGTSIICI